MVNILWRKVWTESLKTQTQNMAVNGLHLQVFIINVSNRIPNYENKKTTKYNKVVFNFTNSFDL